MVEIPAAQWPLTFERISHRYAGTPVVLRQKTADDEQSEVVLWRIPLRSLVAEAHAPGTSLTIRAGQAEPFITISFALVERVSLRFGPEQMLDAMTIASDEGTLSTMIFLHDQQQRAWL